MFVTLFMGKWFSVQQSSLKSEYSGSGAEIVRLHLSGGSTLQYSMNTEAMFAVPANVTCLRQKCLQISVHRC